MAWQTIDGEAVLVNLATGHTLGLNETGGWIWSHIDERSVDEIAASLTERFGAVSEEARQDVAEFIQLLLAEGLVVRKDAE